MTLRNFLEFHDSIISAIALEGTLVRIRLDAYVHRWDRVDGRWKGTGWKQPVQIRLVGPANPDKLDLPVGLAGGEVLVGQVTYQEPVPLPFTSSGPATLRLELVIGKVLDVSGHDLVIESIGEARYVEDLPDDFSPSDAG
jgi:hypothetical protein